MSDSSSFTSLLALVDSHLSKVSILESRSEESSSMGRFSIPGLSPSQAQAGTLSDTRLPRLPLPSFCPVNSPIQNVLAEQVANMIKAKELKKQQEEEAQRQKQLDDEIKKQRMQEEALDIIDLVKVLEEPYVLHPPVQDEGLSSSSSCESLFQPKFIDGDATPDETKTPEPLLPCIQDISYIFDMKIKMAKGSAFGKVLSSRLKPVAAPYLHTRIKSSVVPFDFSTPSPCDIIKERMRRPRPYSQSFLHSDCIGAKYLLESMQENNV